MRSSALGTSEPWSRLRTPRSSEAIESDASIDKRLSRVAD
jgi:hypothetical protein